MRVNEPDLLNQLEKDALHIDCTRIELAGQLGGQDRSYTGLGYIRQLPEKGFEATVIVLGELPLRDAMFGWTAESGTLLSAAGSLSLKATDTAGREWTAEPIWDVTIKGAVGADGYAVTAEVQDLVSVIDDPYDRKKPHLQMVAFGRTKFPATTKTIKKAQVGTEERFMGADLNIAQLMSCGLKIEIHQGDTRLRLEASKEDGQPFHPHLDHRITESLQFSLGIRIPWSYVATTQGGTIRTRITASGRHSWTKGRPPVQVEVVDHTDCIWRMFDQYLAAVLQNVEQHQHPLSTEVWGVLGSARASVEVQALVLAVAVESLLGRFYKDAATVPKATIDGVDDLVKHLCTWNGNANIVRRAVGAVRSIRKIRVGDQLKELVEKGIVDQRGCDAWTSLRNSVAHGDWHLVDDLQDMIDRLGRVRVLFHQLVLHLIGYSGKLTDYGTHGWPLVDYPPQAASPMPTPSST